MTQLKTSSKRLAKQSMYRLFEAVQRFGVDVLPRHFYSEIPSVRDLRKLRSWREPYTMADVAGVDIASQMEFVVSCCTPALVDRQRNGAIWEMACQRNGDQGFGKIEADFLYCLIRRERPRRIIQVGCGVSTAVIMAAAGDEGYNPHIVCVEPFPTSFLREEAAANRIELVEKKAQDVDRSILSALEGNDLLFIDSTHTLQPGGEVPRLILEVLPRLNKGVYVHFHDITFPYDYQPGLLSGDLFFPHESVLLHAFLVANRKFTLRASLSMLHYADPVGLPRYLPNYVPAVHLDGLKCSADGHFPSSAYLQSTE